MTTPLLSRAEWGARPPRASAPSISSEGLTVHYGGDSPWTSADRSSPEAFRASTDHNRCASILRAWQSFHLDGRGWNDLAYNSAVCPHGVRYEGRGVGRRSGANGTNTGNARSCAVVYIAGGTDPVTTEAKAAYLDEAARFGTPLRWDHSDWKPTSCAGAPLRQWEAEGFAAPGTAPAPPPTTPPTVPPSAGAPPFPLAAGSYFGPKSGPARSVSGYYHRRANGAKGHDGLAAWQQQMRNRGWRIDVDGLYGDGTKAVAESFQREKSLGVDGLIGPATWRAAWNLPVT